MENEKSNLHYYEELRAVPQEAKKSFNNGRFSGTDINPMWRIKKMTEIFGMCGVGWYYEIVYRQLEKSIDNVTVCSFVAINLYVKVNGEWSKPIYGEGGNTFCSTNKYEKIITTDEAYKMALTDAFSNATKQLGLGADIWFGNDKIHATKYDQQKEISASNAKPKSAPQSQPVVPALPEEMVASINNCNDVAELEQIWRCNAELQKNKQFVSLVSQRKKQIPI